MKSTGSPRISSEKDSKTRLVNMKQWYIARRSNINNNLIVLIRLDAYPIGKHEISICLPRDLKIVAKLNLYKTTF